MDALKRLEYRGYDSSGVAVLKAGPGGGTINVQKKPGHISVLESQLERIASTIGIAHTRWATHGVPNEINAHPHTDDKGTVAVIHNGIIDNHLKLKEELVLKGHVFASLTDSEVIPHLIAEEYKETGGDLFEAVRKAMQKLEGSYAIVVLHKDHPDLLVCAREKSPMVLGKGVKGSFIASDVTALLKYTNRFLYLEDGDIASVTRDGIVVKRLDGRPVEREWKEVDWSLDDAEKGGFKHYMLKEIYEQPRSLHQTLSGWRSDEFNLPKSLSRTHTARIIDCGTS
jgi:glucosamine--fructose-6-phosphate aminotransferase (isomerizing)